MTGYNEKAVLVFLALIFWLKNLEKKNWCASLFQDFRLSIKKERGLSQKSMNLASRGL